MREGVQIKECRLLDQTLVQGKRAVNTQQEMEVDVVAETKEYEYLSGKVRVKVPNGEDTSLGEIRELATKRLHEILD